MIQLSDRSKTNRVKMNYRLYGFWVLLVVAGMEILLRVLGVLNTWSENVGLGYQSYYNRTILGQLLTRTPNDTIHIDYGEFKYSFYSNSLGLRESDSFHIADTTALILCLGDSYTEGLGTSYENAYPHRLQQILNKNGCNYRTYNAGVAGSDPFYCYMLLQRKLLHLKPDILLMTFNSSDITDYIFRGGMGRFKENDTCVYNKGPWFEPIYENSRFFRYLWNVLLMQPHYNLLVTRSDYEQKLIPDAVTNYVSLYQTIDSIGHKNGFETYVIIQPIAKEAVFQHHDNRVIKSCFSKAEELLKSKGVKCINLWDPLSKKLNEDNYLDYSYKNDCHFNDDGYALFTNVIYENLNTTYPDWLKKKH